MARGKNPDDILLGLKIKILSANRSNNFISMVPMSGYSLKLVFSRQMKLGKVSQKFNGDSVISESVKKGPDFLNLI